MKPTYIRNADEFSAVINFGETRESQVLEFKATYKQADEKHRYELRKDVASLANTWGGVLLIGLSEGDSGHYKAAVGLTPCPIDPMLQWITNTLASFIYPAPQYEAVPFQVRVPKNRGPVIAVNVHPYPDTIGCVALDHGTIKFPRRDDFGVKFYHPLEMFAIVTGKNMRRIRIALNELSGTGKPVVIVSPVLTQRMETDDERNARLRARHGTVSWDGPPTG